MRRWLFIASLLILPWMVQGATIFTEDFEGTTVTPNLSYPPDYFFQDASGNPYRATPSPYPRWLRSDTGFGNGSAGVYTNAEFSGQRLGLRYTNSGYSTDEGEIGSFDAFYATYTMTATAYQRTILSNTGGNYTVRMVVYNPGADRQDFSSVGEVNIDGLVLAEATGTTTSNETITLTYVSDPVLDAAYAGYDVAIRISGSTSSASWDDITVTHTPFTVNSPNVNKACVIAGKLFVPGGSSPQVTTIWTPADIDTVTWFDAYTTASIGYGAGTAVSTWYDKSGNAHDAYQAGVSAQPVFDSANTEIDFDGSDIMAVGNNDVKTDPYKDLQNFAVVAVGKWGTDSENRNLFASFSSAGTGNTTTGWSLRQRIGVCFTLRVVSDTGTTTEPTFGSTFMATGVRYANDDVNTSIDGDVLYNANKPGAIAYSTLTNRSAIGGVFRSDDWSADDFYLSNGSSMKEIVVIDGATQDEVEKTEGYLAWKWGLQDNLPSDHPYKRRRP